MICAVRATQVTPQSAERNRRSARPSGGNGDELLIIFDREDIRVNA
jgi:hypothetical protein